MTNKLQNTEMIICLDCVNFDRSAAQYLSQQYLSSTAG